MTHPDPLASLTPLAELVVEAVEASERAADADGHVLAYLLADEGFTPENTRCRTLTAAATRVTVAVSAASVRVTFPATGGVQATSTLDLPHGTPYGVVAQVVTAINQAAAR